MRDVPDKDPACAGKNLVYANYASALEAKNARDILTVYVNDIWSGKGLVVMIKQDMCNHRYNNTPTGTYFALFVTNTPTGTTSADLEPVFAEYGPLNKGCAIRKIKETEFFVNFMTYAGADKALQASQFKALRFEGSILSAKAEQSTYYIINVKTKMLVERKYSISMDDAKRVAKDMEAKDRPPLPSNIKTLLKAAPDHFVLDREKMLFRLIDPNAESIDCEYRTEERREQRAVIDKIRPAAAPPSMARPCSPKATSEEQAYYADMINGCTTALASCSSCS